jgi:hypothetical protein
MERDTALTDQDIRTIWPDRKGAGKALAVEEDPDKRDVDETDEADTDTTDTDTTDADSDTTDSDTDQTDTA